MDTKERKQGLRHDNISLAQKKRQACLVPVLREGVAEATRMKPLEHTGVFDQNGKEKSMKDASKE